ncbi:hypothetical protein [Crocinitomix catalasitica]|uniref:hypothetical protein n=1 Tax=Crocinitomix catalasitica TaxID=184607 RepID=UPI000481D462|nr:hypothetical protein [Crocinitomix catalasitica]
MNLLKKANLMAVGLLLLFAGCKKLDPYKDLSKITSTSWNPILAVPVAHTEFGVYDILARTDSTDLVIIDPITGEIALTYKGEILSFRAEDLFDIPDFSESLRFSLLDLGPLPAISYSGTATSSETSSLLIEPVAGMEIHSVTFKSGSLDFSFSTDLKHDLTIEIEIPSLLVGGAPINESFELTYDGDVPQELARSIDLAGAIGDFTLDGMTVNEIEANYSITINGTGEEIVGTESFETSIGFTDINYKNATGNFGMHSLGSYSDSILLRIFNNAIDGYFELTNPKIRLEMINSFGFPVEVNLSDLKTVSEVTGETFVLDGYPSTISIPYPTEFGDDRSYLLELNKTNTTNISTIITPVPKYFHFAASGLANPDGPPVTPNFIEDVSQFKINAEIELPLEGFAHGFQMVDTVEFDFSDDVEEVERVMFRLIINNGFPIDLSAGVTFVDEDYTTLLTPTIGIENIVKSGRINADGLVIDKTEQITDISIERLDVPKLKHAKYIIIRTDAETANGINGDIVKLYDFYSLSIKLGMQVEGKLNF